MSRLLAIGDIHGCYSALLSLMKAVDLQCDDVVVTLGDYVDRGPNSKQVLEWLIAQQACNKIVCLRGNHEVMMLNAREQYLYFEEWLASGGQETLESYNLPMTIASLEKIPTVH
jgi:serine/threonine protein phosphatase 1